MHKHILLSSSSSISSISSKEKGASVRRCWAPQPAALAVTSSVVEL